MTHALRSVRRGCHDPITTKDHSDLKMVNPKAAAIDIGSTMRMAAVNPKGSGMPVRPFGTFHAGSA